MTPHQYAIEWCAKRGYCLISLITSRVWGTVHKLHALIYDMRYFQYYSFPEIGSVVQRTKDYCHDVYKGMRARAA